VLEVVTTFPGSTFKELIAHGAPEKRIHSNLADLKDRGYIQRVGTKEEGGRRKKIWGLVPKIEVPQYSTMGGAV